MVTLTREGRNTMPNFRKTEISDSGLEALVAYLVGETGEQDPFPSDSVDGSVLPAIRSIRHTPSPSCEASKS